MKTALDNMLAVSPDYRQFIEDLKGRIAEARLSAARIVNQELVNLYRDIGRGIVEKQRLRPDWTARSLPHFCNSLSQKFPGATTC